MPGERPFEPFHEECLAESSQSQIDEPGQLDRGDNLVGKRPDEAGHRVTVIMQHVPRGVRESILPFDEFLQHISPFAAGFGGRPAVSQSPPGVLEADGHVAMGEFGRLKVAGRSGESGFERSQVAFGS